MQRALRCEEGEYTHKIAPSIMDKRKATLHQPKRKKDHSDAPPNEERNKNEAWRGLQTALQIIPTGNHYVKDMKGKKQPWEKKHTCIPSGILHWVDEGEKNPWRNKLTFLWYKYSTELKRNTIKKKTEKKHLPSRTRRKEVKATYFE